MKKFKRNFWGRDFVVGDVHGHFKELLVEMEKVGFDESKDRLFSTGDLIDRGSESKDVYKWLAQTWFHPVRGNHEQMAIDFCSGKMSYMDLAQNGGEWFVNLTPLERDMYKNLFQKLPFVIEIETENGKVGIVHADPGVDEWSDVDMADEMTILWSRNRWMSRDCTIVKGVDCIYVGHTMMKEEQFLGNINYIDTGIGRTINKGFLTLKEIK